MRILPGLLLSPLNLQQMLLKQATPKENPTFLGKTSPGQKKVESQHSLYITGCIFLQLQVIQGLHSNNLEAFLFSIVSLSSSSCRDSSNTILIFDSLPEFWKLNFISHDKDFQQTTFTLKKPQKPNPSPLPQTYPKPLQTKHFSSEAMGFFTMLFYASPIPD